MAIYSFMAKRLKREAARYREFSEADPDMRVEWLAMAEQLDLLARDCGQGLQDADSSQSPMA
jgi:hypothetical protein